MSLRAKVPARSPRIRCRRSLAAWLGAALLLGSLTGVCAPYAFPFPFLEAASRPGDAQRERPSGKTESAFFPERLVARAKANAANHRWAAEVERISAEPAPASRAEPSWKCGTARSRITPKERLWMAGFAARTRPAEGTLDDLWVKVLALEAPRGELAVFVAADILGFPRAMSDRICAAVQERHGLERSRILLAASHTHSGPVICDALQDIYPLDEGQRSLIDAYSRWLEGTVVATIDEALESRSPVALAAGEGKATFAVNRRTNVESELPEMLRRGVAPRGPSDPTVPVLAVRSPDGSLRCVVFGFAAHTSALSGYLWSADYAGYAQRALEEKHPGAQAMFFEGCGSDQSAAPRGTIERCEAMGKELAAAVDQTLEGGMRPISPRLRAAFELVPLAFGEQPTKAELEAAAGGGGYRARWARRLLGELEAGKTFAAGYPTFPVQVWRLGDDQLWIALGGEVAVDYALLFQAEYGPRTWVAGYSNDVMAYIPSRRIWEEGGYQAGAFDVYGLPASRWAADIEDRVRSAVARLVAVVHRE